VILCLITFVELRFVTDRQTHDDCIYCASVASRGKNVTKILKSVSRVLRSFD